jgi:hypothetical protein
MLFEKAYTKKHVGFEFWQHLSLNCEVGKYTLTSNVAIKVEVETNLLISDCRAVGCVYGIGISSVKKHSIGGMLCDLGLIHNNIVYT